MLEYIVIGIIALIIIVYFVYFHNFSKKTQGGPPESKS